MSLRGEAAAISVSHLVSLWENRIQKEGDRIQNSISFFVINQILNTKY